MPLRTHYRFQANSFLHWLATFVVAANLLHIAGCSGSKFPVRPASGLVTCDGKPVTKGSITFTPIGKPDSLETGKSASATLAQDGSFRLSTFGKFDGAIVGKHRVEFTGNDGEEETEPTEDDQKATAKPKAKSSPGCTLPQELIVEVKSSGENVFKVELTKAKN